MDLDPGYWRSDFESANILPCLRKSACLGGSSGDMINNESVICSSGYHGILCHECNFGTHARSGSHECNICLDPDTNAVRIFALGILVMIFVIVMIIMNSRKTKDSMNAILMRILTNYV